MKVRLLELGKAKDKTDSVGLWDKTHTKLIILKYSFEELKTMVDKEEMK